MQPYADSMDEADGKSEDSPALSQALAAAAGKLREGNEDALARALGGLARKLDDLAGYLERRDPRRVAEDVERFARRHPELFLGSMFAVGLVAGRFLRASRRHLEQVEKREARRSGRPPRRSPVGSYPREG
ncbi:MAG TPA: hypothetical protein VMT16_10255 [Thermoanaerobaculia bacterium]|nr:hypothetical protein [Thermoanaerobaculia bacterium]